MNIYPLGTVRLPYIYLDYGATKDGLVKLQKRFSYKYKGKDYFKHVITIPGRIIADLGWNCETEVESKVEGEKLIVTKKKGVTKNV